LASFLTKISVYSCSLMCTYVHCSQIESLGYLKTYVFRLNSRDHVRLELMTRGPIALSTISRRNGIFTSVNSSMRPNEDLAYVSGDSDLTASVNIKIDHDSKQVIV
jgi:hypothetical protein